METKQFKMIEKIGVADLETVVSLLKSGELVAFPTETVYGLGADATNEAAVQKIFTAKGRPSDNPLIVHVATEEQLRSLAKDVPSYVTALIKQFSPGPITYVLKDAGQVAPTVTAGLRTIGVRIPNHPVALEILAASNLPIAAPSANKSGRPSPTEANHVATDLAGDIAAIVDGGSTDVGIESTVLDCTGAVPLILRPGSITAEDIAAVTGTCNVYKTDQKTEKPKSPGMKYVHYAPEVPLILVSKDEMLTIVDGYKKTGERIGLLYESEIFDSIEVEQKHHMGQNDKTIAQRLYSLLRSFTKEEVDVIICEYPSLNKGHAVVDRLQRAATDIITENTQG